MVAACLRPPLYATRFGAGFGTLYTAEYRPAEGAVSYHWPECTWSQSLDHLRPGTIQVRLAGADVAPRTFSSRDAATE